MQKIIQSGLIISTFLILIHGCAHSGDEQTKPENFYEVKSLEIIGNGAFPKWSPDGMKILWNVASGGNCGEGEELWLMDIDGSNKERLTYFSDPYHEEYDPIARQITESSWHPNGTQIVFGHVSQEERGSPHLPSTLYLLTFE